MRRFKTMMYIMMLVVFMILPVSAAATNDDEKKATLRRSASEETGSSDKKKKKGPPEADTGKDKAASIEMPIYKPPLRGAPAGRVGGGTRGEGDEFPHICVLAPDHAGLTVHKQPTFYWYLSELTDYPIEFTLIESKAINPLFEKRIAIPKNPGIQKIRLAELGDVHLREGFRYKWYIAVILDADHRSKDLISGAEIELFPPNETLKTRLKTTNPLMHPHIYAEEGLWYDAVNAISTLIDTDPADLSLRKMRASLLEQVGLRHIAAQDVK